MSQYIYQITSYDVHPWVLLTHKSCILCFCCIAEFFWELFKNQKEWKQANHHRGLLSSCVQILKVIHAYDGKDD